MIKKIYLIGNIPRTIDDLCQSEFHKAQINLIKKGFFVFNPVDRLCNSDLSFEGCLKKNLNDLMHCDSVYIMPSFSPLDWKKSIELKYALNFNLFIISGVLDIVYEKPKKINKDISKQCEIK